MPNSTNADLLDGLYAFMKSTGASESHCNNTLKTAIAFARYLGPDQSFYDIRTKDKITDFLDTKIKDNVTDPDKRWITTWNDYLGDLKYLFRWLHNYKLRLDQGLEPNSSPSEWETPSFAQIRKKKTKRLSPYGENEIWELDELQTIIKYEPHKRNKAALALMWDLSGRNHEITLLRLRHIRLKEKYGEGEIPHQSKTGSGPVLLTCSFPYVRDWLNEHPFRNQPDSRLICNLMTGAPVKPEALWTMMKCLKERIVRLRDSGCITDAKEQQKLDYLLMTKKWNPYCIRHSAITSDSDYLPDYALKKKARWSMNSKQPSRYIKTRMGDELKQKILVHSGIIIEDQIKKRRQILVCPRCDDVNAIDNKVCSKCSYPLSPESYDEIKSAEDAKFKVLQDEYQEGLRVLEGKIEEEKTRVKNLREQMTAMQEAYKEILDLLRDPIRLAEAVKAH